MQWIAVKQRVVDLESGQVHHQGKVSTLSPRLLTLLRYLVEHTDSVIARDTLIEAVWGHLEAATDDSVNVAVSSLRQAIGDNRRPHRVIKAVPRRGYRIESEHIETLDAAEAIRRIQSNAPSQEAATLPPDQASRQRRPSLAAMSLTLGAVLVIAGSLFWLQPWRGAQNASDIGRAVAVLPFTDMTADGDHGPFADGLADRIIHLLTLSPDLAVTARTSSFAFRESQARISEIAHALGVDVVLEGSVQRADDQIRVLAQLIDADSEAHLWSRTYDRPIGELFTLQDDIANEVARTLTNSLLPDSELPDANSQQVWELITRGRVALDRFTLENSTAAVEYFQQALELEPNNVDALIGLFDALGMQRSQGPMRTSRDTVDIREPYLDRARMIAGDSALVLRAVGDWHFSHGRPDEAISSFRLALERNPNDATAWRNLGRILFRQARYDEAIEPLRTAARLDPYMTLGTVWLADAFWALGRAEEALYRLRDSIERQPNFPQAHDRLATYLLQTGDTAEAMQHILRAQALDPGSTARHFRVCEFWLQLGDDDSAERCSEEFARAHDDPFREGYLRQILHSFRGEWEAHARELEAVVGLGNRRDPLTPALLAQAYSRNDCPAALSLLEERFPALFEESPSLNPMMLTPARTAIHCLQQTERSSETAALLQAHSELVERTRTEQGPWLVSGTESAFDHALHGNYEAALTALEDLVDSGWRYYWWGLDFYPSLQPIVDTERFKRLIARLEAGVAEQRAQFRAMRSEAP